MESRRVCDAIEKASFVLVICGAGLSADSGVATYRGEGSEKYNTWPPFVRGEETPYGLAKERRMREDPHLVWGHVFNRMHFLATKEPHAGYCILYDMMKDKPHFIFSTNVDGMWRKVDTDTEIRIVEFHGCADYVQCINDCSQKYSLLREEDFSKCTYDTTTGRLEGTLPTCDACGELKRPNVHWIGDTRFCGVRRFKQQTRYERFLNNIPKDGTGIIIEVGCGKALPTARYQTRDVRKSHRATVIRINPEEPLDSDYDECDHYLRGSALKILCDIVTK